MNKLIYLITVMSLASYTPKVVTIHLSTIGAKDSTIYLSRPIENLSIGVTDTIRLQNGKDTTITLEIAELSTMYIRNDNQQVPLIVEPGANYNLKFDYTATPIVTVNDSAQMVLNRVFADKDFYKYEWVKEYSKAPLDTVASQMLANFETLLATDKTQFTGIKMSLEKRAFINKHLELYWIGSLSKVIHGNYYNEVRNQKPMFDGYAELWQSIYQKYPLTVEMTPSYLLRPYTGMMRFMHKKQAKDQSQPTTFEQYLQEQYDYIYNTITDLKIRKAVLASMLYFDCLNNDTHDKAILPHINKFNVEYPNTPYSARLQPFVESIVDFNNCIKNDFSPEVKFVTNGDSIKTFTQVIAQFKGKPIFVDFWFTTCGSCREQFKHSTPLKKFLKENGIEMLYVSIDHKEKDWHNSIKFFNLEGNHIRTRKELHKDLYEKYGIHLYPHYMIIDADGKIVVNRAKEPSEEVALFDQIKEALKK